MPTESLIAAALHYVGSDRPFYEHEEATPLTPKCGTGDSRYMATQTLLQKCLLVQAGKEPRVWFNATDGLKLYVKTLLTVQLPTQVWWVDQSHRVGGS